METILAWLDGKKTYIFVVLYAATEVLSVLGYLTIETSDMLKALFLSGAGLSLRAALKK